MGAIKQANTIVYGDIAWDSVYDGPGRRVVLYLRGCKLRCPWCHSPHLWDKEGCLLWFDNRCLRCGECQTACPRSVHQVQDGRHELDRGNCGRCGACLKACPVTIPGVNLAAALAIPVFHAQPEELFRQLRPQLDLLRRLGGLTVSGGEPLLQYRSLGDLLQKCQAEGIHVAVETSGSASRAAFAALLEVVDCWLFGLRPVSAEIGRLGAVADPRLVRRNLAYLVAHKAPQIVIRTPVIPQITDTPECLASIAETMQAEGLASLELLPWNPYASHYYEALGLRCPLETSAPTEARLSMIRCFFAARGIRAEVPPTPLLPSRRRP